MSYEQKDGQGALFKNDKEGGNPSWPDYKGDCMIDGKRLYISAWLKEGKKGKFLSLSFQPPKDKADTKPKPRVPVDDDPEIPF